MDPADWTSQIDQLVAGARDLGKAAAAFYKSAVGEGLTEPVAMALTAAWLAAVLQPRPEPEQ